MEPYGISFGVVGDPNWGPECCIYKVPKRLRKVKEEAYTPKLISIGPVHHNNSELKEMQMVKERYFKSFFSQTYKGQKEFACIIEKNKDKICNCYAPEISQQIKNENFVEMKEENDYILSKPWLKDGIMQDLILLENQLPFFILDKLYQHFTGNPNFLELACMNQVKHFTDLQRNFFHSPKQIPGDPIEHRHSATKLDMAGLIFQNEKGPEKNRRKDDVELLVEEGIIVHSLGSNKAVAEMVNKLGQEIVEENSYYCKVAEDLNKYYRNWWNKNMESLKTVYFRDIWRGTATVVGIIVLVVTIMNFLGLLCSGIFKFCF
ncbi:hypothetical protein RGQ29_031804 [Quercus rubra]|uniref:Uncharacterized protein n=1 Tax=Quercus rubra TaxID=3512 RepID=A0AAN7DU00_QUERU|nr:hypothetical protein RGQ29_031804 [Quercus rubra]